MKRKYATLAAALLALAVPESRAQLTLLSNINANQTGGFSAGEIPAFDRNTNRLFVTSSGSSVYRVNIFDMQNPTNITEIGTVDFSTTFGTSADMLGLSSVAVDPQGRFGAATLIPTTNATALGKIGFFNLSTGAVIGTANVGYHPDSLTFSSDGSRLVVVNEGEFNPSATTNPTAANAPGSISVFDLSGIHSGNLASLPALSATTKDFSSSNLAPGVSLSGIRNPNVAAIGTSGAFIAAVPDFTAPANQDHNAIEPEYATISGNKVLVSLQDNNGVGEYDLTSNQWTKITSLGTITQTIDATDTGSSISITQTVKGMPMPDTVSSYSANGKTYLVTANEGDARVDDHDASRFGDTGGNDSMNTILDSNYPSGASGSRANAELGRLNVSRIDGDTDADGKIDDIRMFGTRSFSIWEVTDGGLSLAYDSDSFFETYIAANDTAGWLDSRSDDKGPEPEGLTLGSIDGRTYAFISMERNNGIFMFDVTDPESASFFGYTRTQDGANTPLRPEGMAFISSANSPNGQNLLVVGFEGDGTNGERVGVYSVVPEPSTSTLLFVSAIFVAAYRSRNQKKRR